jgi:predicted permease
MIHDLRYAVRLLFKTPAFSLPAVLSLALGVGANTTIFSIVNALLLRPLGATDAARLIRIGQSVNHDGTFRAVSHAEYVYIRDHSATLDGVIGHEPQPMTLGAADGPQVVWGEIVSGNYFSVLQVTPPLGRGFVREEDRVPDERPALVISDGLWRRRFGSDPAVVGRTVSLNVHRFTIVGVAPPGFRGTFPGFDIDLWVPVMMHGVAAPGSGRLGRRDDRFMLLIGRLKSGVSMQTARTEIQALGRQLEQAFPDANRNRGLDVASASGVQPFIALLVTAFLALLMGIVGLVLLIACANVATLLLARATARRRELAIRLAVGAGRARLVRQLLVESLVLALAGGGAGLVMSFWSARRADRAGATGTGARAPGHGERGAGRLRADGRPRRSRVGDGARPDASAGP